MPHPSHEVVFDLVEEAFFAGTIVDGQHLAQLFEKFTLLPGEARGHLHGDVDIEIAAVAAIENRHALMADLELRPVLRAFGNLEFVRRAKGDRKSVV